MVSIYHRGVHYSEYEEKWQIEHWNLEQVIVMAICWTWFCFPLQKLDIYGRLKSRDLIRRMLKGGVIHLVTRLRKIRSLPPNHKFMTTGHTWTHLLLSELSLRTIFIPSNIMIWKNYLWANGKQFQNSVIEGARKVHFDMTRRAHREHRERSSSFEMKISNIKDWKTFYGV